MAGEKFSDQYWEDAVGKTKLDLDMIWETADDLKEVGVGDDISEKLMDLIFKRPFRENLHEDLKIVPIKNAERLTKEEIHKLANRKRHMFESSLWKLVSSFYLKQNQSFRGFNINAIADSTRSLILQTLGDDRTNVSFQCYNESLNDAAYVVSSTIAEKISESIIGMLRQSEKEKILAEAKEDFSSGNLHFESHENPNDSDLLLEYIYTKVAWLITQKPADRTE